MAFSWRVVKAVVKETSAITFDSPVVSMTTKLSLETARRLTVSAGEVSEVQCQDWAELCRKPDSCRNVHNSVVACGPNFSPWRMGSSKAAHFRWLNRMS